MASTFGAAFDKLDREVQRQFIQNMNIRRDKYVMAMAQDGHLDMGVERIILGDTPGPGRPDDPNYHHTPFYSTKNSSLWMNKQLVEAGVDERKLLWFNTTLADGSPLNHVKVINYVKIGRRFICLGGNAEKWLRTLRPLPAFETIYHPQYAKRFRSKEPYELVAALRNQVTPGLRGMKHEL